MSVVDLDIHRLPRGGYVIVQGRRQVVPTVYPSEEDAAYRLPTLEKTMRREQATWRTCLCCTATFPSEGAHNRMCDPCRANPTRAF